jgi:hypothetical protein
MLAVQSPGCDTPAPGGWICPPRRASSAEAAEIDLDAPPCDRASVAEVFGCEWRRIRV